MLTEIVVRVIDRLKYLLPFKYVPSAVKMMSSLANISSYELARATLFKLGGSGAIWEREGCKNNDVNISWEEFTEDPRWRLLISKKAQQVGLTQYDLDKLSVIHVAGTKGKGSTCHFVESILRAHGYKVGLFSSPHIMRLTERIRINGRCISRDSFADSFWHCYDKLTEIEIGDPREKLTWFICLTLMAIHVFTLEQVDVAIMETGLGGQYDATNMFSSPVVCGISTLDYDHVNVLGDKITEIAWHKAGIFKQGVPAYTVMQPENSIQVLKRRAREKECSLKLVPDFEEYDFGGAEITLGIQGDVQRINASLAMQLCKEWINKRSATTGDMSFPEWGKVSNNATITNNHPPAARPFVVPSQMKQGLRQCFYPGRSQVIYRPGLTFYVDVAHTPKSVQASSAWFTKVSSCEHKRSDVLRIGMVSLAKDRNAEVLMERMLASEPDFDYIVIAPGHFTEDAMRRNPEFQDKLLENITKMETACIELLEEKPIQDAIGKAYRNCHVAHLESDISRPSGYRPQVDSEPDMKHHLANPTRPKLVTLYDLQEAIYWVSGGRDSRIPVPTTQSLDIPEDVQKTPHIQVFVTCSAKLATNVIKAVDPGSLDHY